MSLDRVMVRAPSTIANLGAGFDVFGIALKDPFDMIEARRTSEQGVRVEKIEGIGAHAVTIEQPRTPPRSPPRRCWRWAMRTSVSG